MAALRKKTSRLVNLKPSKKGIRQVLGDLETDIMEVLWRKNQASVREVHEILANDRNIAYTTVMTVMSRLAEKGLLMREQHGRAYLYAPTQTREEFCSETIGTVVQGLIGGFGEPVLSQFVDTVSAQDADQLDELVRLIEAKKKEAAKSATSP
ncbi:MAG: BlaI/MecI/CopY family transcriptional regulator [Actinobacteria bacterium]|nr:BlaI/MecI/CopY family transcriptional regulator [Actinomycetota bacterium]